MRYNTIQYHNIPRLKTPPHYVPLSLPSRIASTPIGTQYPPCLGRVLDAVGTKLEWPRADLVASLWGETGGGSWGVVGRDHRPWLDHGDGLAIPISQAVKMSLAMNEPRHLVGRTPGLVDLVVPLIIRTRWPVECLQSTYRRSKAIPKLFLLLQITSSSTSSAIPECPGGNQVQVQTAKTPSRARETASERRKPCPMSRVQCPTCPQLSRTVQCMRLKMQSFSPFLLPHMWSNALGGACSSRYGCL